MHDLPRFPAFFWWLAAFVLATLSACSGEQTPSGAGGAPGRGVYVPLAWSTDRRVTGHRVHVVEQGIACNACHELNATAVGVVSPSRCATCHQDHAGIEHAARLAQQRFGKAARADCTNCHAFTGEASHPDASDGGALEPYGPKDCARCHEKAQGQIPAVVVHATAECVSCHRPHQDRRPISADCTGCHGAISTTHAALGKSQNAVCTTCHSRQHAPAAEALGSCAECHSQTPPIVPKSALFAGGHTQCVSCHRPHAFEASRAVPCRSCHANVVVLAAATVPAHALCTSCHAPHDVRGAPAAACAKCHWDVHADHPERVAGAGCLTCHDPHPGPGQEKVIARTCTSCHQVVANDHAFHAGVACQKCHTPHHFKITLAQHDLCQECHQKELSLVATRVGHAACKSCHGGLPHQPTVLASTCAACHANEAREVRRGHQLCSGCHEPHGGGVTTDCKTCHAQEFTSAPLGHRACVNCHQPHSGSIGKVVCATCHVPEAQSAHGKLASGCLNCHRAHGPSGVAIPPACTTCHAVASLPGLHQQAQHQECRHCHGGHGDAPNAERLACLSCHADRRNHFPDAARCANCHLFQSATH